MGLKEVTNKLESSPISFKPSWTGPKIGSNVVVREGSTPKTKDHAIKACLAKLDLIKEDRLGLKAGPNSARPPNLVRLGDKKQALSVPHLVAETKRGQDERSRGSTS